MSSEKPLVLYGLFGSPPFRGAFLVAKEIGVELDIKIVNIVVEEHHTEEFLKVNPMHTVPVLDDNGLIITDSHAIAGYLVQQYGKKEHQSLYPAEPKKRALIDSKLHFDSGIFFKNLRLAIYPVLFDGELDFPESAVKKVLENYGFMEKFLAKGPWVTGENMTIADLTIAGTATSLVEIIPAPEDEFPAFNGWLNRIRALPYYGLTQEGVDRFRALIEGSKARNRSK